MKDEVVVIKRNTSYQETWRYTGQILRRYPRAILLEALFNRDDTPFHGILLGRGDRFVEIYYTDRWYNIFEMHDREDDRVKGWYCNVSRPAELTDGQISYVDLALDLLIYPDGHMLVLDEDEFAALALDEATHASALAGLEALKRVFQQPGKFPFVETQDQ